MFFPANLSAKYGKTNTNTTKQACIHNKIYYNRKWTPKKLKPGLVASYDLQPGNGEGLFWFQRFINYLLTHLATCLQPQDPNGAHVVVILLPQLNSMWTNANKKIQNHLSNK